MVFDNAITIFGSAGQKCLWSSELTQLSVLVKILGIPISNSFEGHPFRRFFVVNGDF